MKNRLVFVLLFTVALSSLVCAQTGFQDIKIDGSLIFPQIAVGGGYQMVIVVMNLATTGTVNGTLRFFNSDATPMEVLLQTGRGSQIAVEVPAGATIYVPVLAPGAALQVGWAMLEMQGLHSLVFGTVIYARYVESTLTTQVGVTASRYQLGQFMRILSPVMYDKANLVDTGIAIVNTGAAELVIQVALLGLDGKVIDNAEIRLAPGHHSARFVSEIFSSYFTAHSDVLFQGALKLETTKEGMVALALLMSGNVLTSLPVVPLPKVGLGAAFVAHQSPQACDR
jgi:hypothetical protein